MVTKGSGWTNQSNFWKENSQFQHKVFLINKNSTTYGRINLIGLPILMNWTYDTSSHRRLSKTIPIKKASEKKIKLCTIR